jgi:phenylacetate-coenzyme A ligase PaaK-like adenylate-forming protein
MDSGLSMRQRLYFGYHRLNGGNLGEEYRRLLADDRAGTPPERATEGLQDVLLHAASSVPYYAKWLGGREREIEADPEAVLESLPILTRDVVRDRMGELCAADAAERDTIEQTSGGSTGQPVRILQDASYRSTELALSMLQASWTGWRFGEPEIWIWGSERDILEGGASLSSRLGSRLTGRRYFNAFKLGPADMRELLTELDRKPPRLIVAYAHTLDDLASFGEAESIALAPQSAIVSTASTLHPLMRERIERFFGCRVYDQYGSREVGDIACQCGHGDDLHVLPWTNYVEVVDREGRAVAGGEEGRVIVTSLTNFAMPLIRYEVGDRARLAADDAPPCPCGRRGRRLAQVLGRIGDTFKALDGSHIASGYFIHMLFYREFVKEFQVVQTDPGTLVYRLAITRQPQQHELDQIAADTRAAMGEGCDIDFRFEDEIPVTASGKRRYTICEC